MNIVEATETILEKSGYLENLEKEETIESHARIENVEELLRSMQEFCDNEGGAVGEYLDKISLISDMDRYDDQNDYLSLMTIHNSKGLEYPYVLIVGMEEGIFPHQRSIQYDDPEEVEEERRLCYVAMTRAQEKTFAFLCGSKTALPTNSIQSDLKVCTGDPCNLVDSDPRRRYFPKSL